MLPRRMFRIYITEEQIASARENVVKFPTHVEYVAWRFLSEHNVRVLNHKLLKCSMAQNHKMFMYEGEVGVAVSDRIS